jgi:hypothetical protein
MMFRSDLHMPAFPGEGLFISIWMVTDGYEENDVVPTIDGNGTGLCWVQYYMRC